MSIYSFVINFAGETNDVVPRLGRLYSKNDSLATITAAGYLDRYLREQSVSVLPTDLIAVVGSDGAQWYKPVFTGTSCRLTALP